MLRVVTVAAIAFGLLLSNHAIAVGAPSPAGEPNAALNRQLASLAVSPAPLSRIRPAPLVGLFAPVASERLPKRNWLSNPSIMAIAARFTSAEQILHFRHGGFDANFWGILNRGRGIVIRYSARL